MEANVVGDTLSKGERVKVYCRVRPFLSREQEGLSYEEYAHQQAEATFSKTIEPETNGVDDSNTFLTDKEKQVHGLGQSVVSIQDDKQTLQVSAVDNASKTFCFDSSCDETTSQSEMYDLVAAPVVRDFLDGYHGAVLAYGQTATGKTFTMVGQNDAVEGDNRGIIPRALEDIFEAVGSDPPHVKTTIALSYVQLYCERIFDLLDPSIPPNSITVKEDSEYGVYVDGASMTSVTNAHECLNLFTRGNENRAVANTGMNAQSSRSHAVLTLRLERREYPTVSSGVEPTQQVRISHLHLVDLAGSERVKKTKVYGRHARELRAINLSLSALGNCIAALSKRQKHIPYRDSKLTRVLQSSLGGNAKTALVVTISPSITERSETVSSLQFGQRAREVIIRAHRNIMSVLDYKSLYEHLQQQLDDREQVLRDLESELADQKSETKSCQDDVVKAQIRIQHLEFELQSAKTSLLLHQRQLTQQQGAETAAAFTQELEQLIQKHEEDVKVVQEKCNLQIETYKKLAEGASEEWHEVENELVTSKEQVLQTLQDLKDFKKRYYELEEESTGRIAELLQQEKELERDLQAQKEFMETETRRKDAEIDQLTRKLEGAEAKGNQLESRMESDCVPREMVDKMEKLYEGAIAKLQDRVGKLEIKASAHKENASAATSGSNQTSDRVPVSKNRLQKPGRVDVLGARSAVPGKALPQVGRIMPPARVNNSRPDRSKFY